MSSVTLTIRDKQETSIEYKYAASPIQKRLLGNDGNDGVTILSEIFLSLNEGNFGFFDKKGLAINHAGTFAYTTTLNDFNIYVIDTTTYKVTATIPFPEDSQRYHPIVIHPNDTIAYVGTSNGLIVVDLTTMKVTDTILIPTESVCSSLALSPTGDVVYVCHHSTISVIAFGDQTNLIQLDNVGDGINKIVIDPNGLFAYVISFSLNPVAFYVIDLSSYVTNQIVLENTNYDENPVPAYDCIINSEGTKLYIIILDSANIYTVDITDHKTFSISKFVVLECANNYMAINSAGTILYVNNAEQFIFKIDLSTFQILNTYQIDPRTSSVIYPTSMALDQNDNLYVNLLSTSTPESNILGVYKIENMTGPGAFHLLK
jgi:YVTN family beta-propeller protein